MKKLVFALAGIMLIASGSALAEIYKWKNSKGEMQYSDSPPLSNIPYTTLSGKKPPGAPTAPADTENSPQGEAKVDAAAPAKPGDAASKPADSKPSDKDAAQKKAAVQKAAQEAEAKKQQEEKAEAEKKAKEAACRSAKAKVAQFKQGGRIYRINEQGEREYYGDEEIANGLKQAQEDVEANCE